MVVHGLRSNVLEISIPQRQIMPIPAYDTYVYKLLRLHTMYLYHAAIIRFGLLTVITVIVLLFLIE
jgi:hypothetical protein